MHIVTKFLVVFAAVLSILLAALSIAFSTNAERIKANYGSLQAELRSVNTARSDERTEHGVELANRDTEIAALNDQIAEVMGEKESLLRDNARLLADTKVAESTSVTMQSRIDQLAAMSQTQATLIKSMYEEVAKLRDNELRYAQKEIQLADRINDLTGQIEVARETNRALQERLADVQSKFASDTGGSASGRAGRSDAFNSPLLARVTSVQHESGSGALLAEIDAGSADEIREGMDLNIIRDGKFLGNLHIEKVSLNEAVGSINTMGRSVEIRAGDSVISRLR